jgi:hypothetical protein
MRTAVSRRLLALAVVSLVRIGSGCGDGVTLVPVSGKVTLDSAPLEGATLSFVPVPGNPVSTAGTDVSGPSGNFQMTFNGRAGLAPGKYKVSVSKTEEVSLPNGKQIPEVFAKASLEKKLLGATKETIPPQSFDREVEVPANGASDFALDFKSKGKKESAAKK